MSLSKAQGCSKLPDDDFIPNTKHRRLSASNLKKEKQHFASYYSIEEIEAANQPTIVKTHRILLCELLMWSRHGRGVKQV